MIHINRLKRLAIILDSLTPPPSPKPILEQYMLSGEDAAKILWFAGRIYNDISGKIVLDLGCGAGILSLGAVLLGADFVVGVDVDHEALNAAFRNSLHLGFNAYSHVTYLCSDIRSLNIHGDTVIQNPPFGVQHRGADRFFLKKALESADVVYSLHKYTTSTHKFLLKFIENMGGRVVDMINFSISIPHLFNFHHKTRHKVNVVLYRILREK